MPPQPTPQITADTISDQGERGCVSEIHARELADRRATADAQSGKPTGARIEKTTFETLASILLDDLRANGRKVKKKHAPLEHARTFFGDGCRAQNITTDRLTAYVNHRREQGAANATINRSLAALRRAFNLALRAERVATAPHFPMLREDNAREVFIEQAQFLALRAALPDDLKDHFNLIQPIRLQIVGSRRDEMPGVYFKTHTRSDVD